MSNDPATEPLWEPSLPSPPPKPDRSRLSLGPRTSLRGRLAASHLFVASLVVAVVALWLPPAVQRYQLASLEGQLADEARLVRRLIQPLMPDASRARSTPKLEMLTRQVAGEIGARITIIEAGGRVLADSTQDSRLMERHGDRPEVREALRTGLGESRRYSRTLGMDRLYVAVPVYDSGRWALGVGRWGVGAERPTPSAQRPLGVVRLSVSLSEVRGYTEGLRERLLIGLIVAGLAAVGLSFFLTLSVTRPLSMLRDVALGLAHGDLTRRAPLRSRDEIGELARAFDGMATRLEKTIAELGRDRSQMRAVFDTMADGLLVADSDGRVGLLNPAAAALLGVDARGAAGKTVLEITLDAPLQALVEEVLRSGTPSARERVLRAPAERVVAVSAVPIRAAGGGEEETGRRPEGAVLVFHDLTGARRVERMRRDFVANASHELRTPLASMRVMVETLLNGAREDPEAAQRFLKILDRELGRMTSLVNDLLALSRLDAPVEAVTLERVELAPLVNELEVGWQAVAQERGLRLVVRVPATLAVQGEKGGVRQILSNLVDNALKYTVAGEIQVSARHEDDRAVLEISDTGIGIPAADLDRIFERFYRVDKDRSRDLGGTGLGLSIVKHLSLAYGGSVSVQSRLNRGSTFRVVLPLAGEAG